MYFLVSQLVCLHPFILFFLISVTFNVCMDVQSRILLLQEYVTSGYSVHVSGQCSGTSDEPWQTAATKTGPFKCTFISIDTFKGDQC